MREYSAVFCDIDGTLLNRGHRLTPATVAAVRAVAAAGARFILVSARMPDAMYPVQDELGLEAPMVCYSGALVLDERREPVHSVGIDMPTAADIKARLDRGWPDLATSVYAFGNWLVDDDQHPLVRLEVEITGVPARIGGVDDLPASGGVAHKIFCVGEPERILAAERALAEAHPELSICKSSPRYLEIMHGAATKENALRYLCRAMRLPREETVAFGDNYNDAGMIAAAGLGVAMGNAPESVRLAAGRVAPDHDHDGVAAVLRELPFRPMRHSTRFGRAGSLSQ